MTLLILGSLIMISLGIIGEYIAKIYDEIKGRPSYLIASTCGAMTSSQRVGLRLRRYGQATARFGPIAMSVPRDMERELRGYLECGILACGFARARCSAFDHDGEHCLGEDARLRYRECQRRLHPHQSWPRAWADGC